MDKLNQPYQSASALNKDWRELKLKHHDPLEALLDRLGIRGSKVNGALLEAERQSSSED